MKLWIFSTIWKHVSKYWNQFASLGSKTEESGTREVKLSEIKSKNFASSTKKKGRLYKFNPKEFSDSSEPGTKPFSTKTKSIIKRKCNSFMKVAKKDILISVEPEKTEVKKLCDSFGDEISSIDGKSSRGSSTTIKKFLGYLDEDSFSSVTR